MKPPKYEIVDIINRFGEDFIKKHTPNSWTLRVLNSLTICRTSSLGGHKEQCDTCKKIRISYNSCRNRNCPKCQATKQSFWVEDISERIIDTKYFHIVFTVPHELNEICIQESRVFYNTLFSSVWLSLKTLGYSHYSAESGALAILHTWGQNLSLHPHIHCLVPACGITISGKMKKIGKKGKYLYPVRKISIDFRSVMMKSLKKLLIKKGVFNKYQSIIDKAWSKNWVIYAEPSFADAQRVIKYLGRYTHRVAINNHRILKIDKKNVFFRYKDYRDNARIKPTVLSGVEFLRRFCMHILPKGFVKIRYYGIMSNRFAKQTSMYRKITKKPDKENVTERIKRLTGFDITCCPYCKKGKMHRIEIFPRIRSPVKFLKTKKTNKTI